VRLAQGGIREHDAFLGHEMRAPAGTGRGGVSMAEGLEGQGARKGNGVRGHRLPSPPCFVENFCSISAFCLDEKGVSEHLFYVLIYMNSDIFRIYLILFISL